MTADSAVTRRTTVDALFCGFKAKLRDRPAGTSPILTKPLSEAATLSSFKRRSKAWVGARPLMLSRALRRAGLRGWHLHACSSATIGLCIGLWIRAKAVDQDERGNAERRPLFVRLWPPTLWLVGDSLERRDV